MPKYSVVTYAALVTSMFLWGGTWIAGRVLATSMHPMSAAFLRFLLASLSLVIMHRMTRGVYPRIRKKDILPLAFLGATGVFLYSFFFFTGLKTIPASRASLIVACIPACISAASAVLFKEKFGPLRIFGTLLSLCGTAVVIADGNPLDLLHGGIHSGDLIILGCVVSWTAYTLGGRSVMKRIDPLTAVTWSCIFGTLMILGPALYSDMPADAAHARLLDWGCLLFLAVPATCLAFYWYYRAVQAIGAAAAGIFINLVPVFAVLLGGLLLNEPLHASLLTGGCMTITGVYLTNRP